MTHEHLRIADRLLFTARNEENVGKRRDLILEAQAHATLALAQEQETGNLLAAYRTIDREDHRGWEHPGALKIIRRTIRRRLGLFPPLTRDGEGPNGGNARDGAVRETGWDQRGGEGRGN